MPVPRPSYPMISDIQLMAVAKDAGYEAKDTRKLATFFRRLMDKQAIDERENYRYVDDELEKKIPKTLIDAKGDLIAGSGNDNPQRFPVGPNRRVLIADSSTSHGMRWDWLKVGGPNAHRIELHDHADPSDPDSDDGFFHFLSPEPEAIASGGRLYQATRGVGGARQSEIVFFPAGLGRDWPVITMLSESVDGTLKASIVLSADVAIQGPTAAPTQGNDLVNKAYVDNGSIPIGGIILWTAATLPSPYLYCQGQAVSRTTYAALFAVIGTTYGAGDGSTTFNVPNLNNRLALGVGQQANLGAVADISTHFHNTQTSLNLNTGSFNGVTGGLVGNTGLSGGFTHSHYHDGSPKTVQDGAFHEHSFGVGVNTGARTANHTHDYASGSGAVLGTAAETQEHLHSLQGKITTAANVHHTHGINDTTVTDHNHGMTHDHSMTHNHNVGTHNHGSTANGGVPYGGALGLYFAIRAF